MEDFVSFSLAISPFFFLLLYGITRVSYSIWWKPKWLERSLRRQRIRGAAYKLVMGDMKEFVKQITEAWSKPMPLNHQIVPRVDPFTLNNVQKYGKISMCWIGKLPRLIIKDPELMKEVLSNKLGNFQKPPLNPLILSLSRGLASLEGEKWANRRRMINPAFYLEKLKGMIPVFATSCYQMIKQWKNMAGLQESFEIDVWPELQKLTADVISRAAFGSSYEEGKKIFELQKELIKLTIEAMQSVYIPGFRYNSIIIPSSFAAFFLWFLHLSMYWELLLIYIHVQIHSYKKESEEKDIEQGDYINAEKCNPEERASDGNRTIQGDDLLGMLLQYSHQNDSVEHANGKENRGMTIEDVIEECKQFYTAGQETTSSLLTWTIIVLAMHTDWQERAREEVLEVCQRKEPDFEAISRLKIVTTVLYEVLRLYPPVIAQYQHCYKKTRIGEISIPAGVDITLPTLLIHHDPELWGDDAEEFKPERFSEGVSKASKDQPAFFPFSWGPRTCIGQNFAILEAKVALVMILQHFSFELSPSYSHAPCTVLTLQPQHGAQIKLYQI